MKNSFINSEIYKSFFDSKANNTENRLRKRRVLHEIKENININSKHIVTILNSEIQSTLREKFVSFIWKIFKLHGLSMKTFFISIRIFDEFIKKQNYLTIEILKEYLLAGMLLACKFYEPRGKTVINEILHYFEKSLFSRDIFLRELEILNCLNWNLIYETTYDSIKQIFNQMNSYHSNNIEELKLTIFFKEVETLSISLCILCLKFEELSKYDNIKIASMCILISINKKMKVLHEEKHIKFVNSFIYYLMKKFKIGKDFFDEFFKLLCLNYEEHKYQK